MKLFQHILMIALVPVLHSSLLVAQQAKPYDPVKEDIQSRLPSLETLIDSAVAHDPYVSFRFKQIYINSCKLHSDQKQWMRDIGFQADYRYGTFDNFSTNTSEGQSPTSFSTTRSESKYGLGAYIKFPLFDIVNRTNQVNLAKGEINQASDMYEMQVGEVRQKVIRQYNDLIVRQKIFQIKTKYLETARMNGLMAEKEFLNGIINVSEYARLASINSQAEADYESAKMDFKTSYMILEEIVRMKLNININNL